MSEPFRSELFKVDVPDSRLEISDIRMLCEMTLTEKCGCSQYIAIPMKEQPLPRMSHQVSPRGSPSVPPSRRSSRRKMPTSAQVNQLLPPPPPPPPRDDEPCYSEIKKDRERPWKTVAEEKNSIVYAALNHQPLEGTAAAAARPRRPIEENSEYAAIRVS